MDHVSKHYFVYRTQVPPYSYIWNTYVVSFEVVQQTATLLGSMVILW